MSPPSGQQTRSSCSKIPHAIRRWTISVESSRRRYHQEPSSIDTTVNITRRWINSFVVDLNLCPFARREVMRNSLRFTVFEDSEPENILHALSEEITLLHNSQDIETSFLILPAGMPDFRDFNDFLYTAQSLTEALGWEGIYQLVGFHPQYQFSDTEPDDAENYTNRSPFPMLHILRESSVSDAVATTQDAALIPERNVTTLGALGTTALKARWRSCFTDPAAT
ncbi:MAG: hypothetical protein CME46_09105 [Halieaceae bacterium]|nr:hypothetical protein [Halieaceae bacterium]